MQTRLLFLLLIMAFLTAQALAQIPNATLVITGGRLIDGTGSPPVFDAAVVITGGRIADVGPSSKIAVPKNTKTIDGRGKWIILGLAAPRVAVAGPLISTVAADDLETADPAIIEVNNPEQAVALVRRELARKPDLIKIWFIRGPGVELELAVKSVEAVVKASHAADVRVAVHATELETAKAAVRAGSDILVHTVSDRPRQNPGPHRVDVPASHSFLPF
jgi:hypothetical protein